MKREKILLSIILASRLKKVFVLKPLSIFHNTFSETSEIKGLFVGLFCGELLNLSKNKNSLKWLYPIEKEKYKGNFAEFFNAKKCLSQQFQMFPKLTIAQLCFR